MMGVPLVASNFGPVTEVVENAGILVKPKAKYISDAIEKLIKEKQLRDSLIKKGLKRVKLFDIENVADKYLTLLNKINEI